MSQIKQEKKSKYFTITILAALVFLFSLAVLFKMPVKTSSISDSALIVNTQLPDDVVSVDISNPLDKYQVLANKGSCSISELQNIPTSEEAFDLLLANSSRIRATQLVNEETYDLGEYGLDTPHTIANIKYKDNTETTLNIGNEAPMSAGIYVNFSGTTRVYLFPEEYLKSFSYTKMDYVSKNIVPRVSSSGNTMNVSKVTFKGAGRSEDLVVSLGTSTDNTTTYTLKKGDIVADGDRTKSLAIMNEIKNLSAENVEIINPSPGDIEKYGLKEPYATAVVALDDKPATVVVSVPDAEGNCYIMNKSVPVIFKTIADKEDWIDVTFEDMVNRNILNDPITSLKKLTISDDKDNYEFLFETSLQDNSNIALSYVSCNGQIINSEDFKNFYQKLSSCTVASFTSDKIAENAKPMFSYKFEYIDTSKEVNVVDFYRSNDGLNAFVYKNGKCNSIVSLSYIDDITSELKKLMGLENTDDN